MTEDEDKRLEEGKIKWLIEQAKKLFPYWDVPKVEKSNEQ